MLKSRSPVPVHHINLDTLVLQKREYTLKTVSQRSSCTNRMMGRTKLSENSLFFTARSRSSQTVIPMCIESSRNQRTWSKGPEHLLPLVNTAPTRVSLRYGQLCGESNGKNISVIRLTCRDVFSPQERSKTLVCAVYCNHHVEMV